jgi:hypothetical protein
MTAASKVACTVQAERCEYLIESIANGTANTADLSPQLRVGSMNPSRVMPESGGTASQNSKPVCSAATDRDRSVALDVRHTE